MKPVEVVWLCDECGETFSRKVTKVITDDGEDVTVKVQLFEGEEAPLCPCLTEGEEVADETEESAE